MRFENAADPDRPQKRDHRRSHRPIILQFDTWAVRFPSELPVGIRRYGKVITKADSEPGPGYNMVVDENGYRFLDQDGKEVKIEVLEVSPFIDEDIPVLDECEPNGGAQ